MINKTNKTFDQIWEKKYIKGHSQLYPWDIVVSFVYRNIPQKISNRNIFCKGGAEGVFLFVHLKKEVFGILKVKDGNERALSSAMYTLLKKFKILTREELDQFNSWNTTDMYNHAKIKVGNIITKIE